MGEKEIAIYFVNSSVSGTNIDGPGWEGFKERGWDGVVHYRERERERERERDL
jgi:hypothetical protein